MKKTIPIQKILDNKASMRIQVRFLWMVVLLFFWLFFWVPSGENAYAWTDHQTLTKTALSIVPEIVKSVVTFTTFDQFIQSLGYKSPEAFNQSIQIKKKYRFEAKMHEAPAASLPLVQVIATYSDEPDWGMDQELFDEAEYPELWRSEYAMMGGKKGTPSQAFRHMYWSEWSYAHPLATFKLPLSHLFRPMGLAPERALVFVELSRKAALAGHPYWAARFLGNALHYLEDVAQPYHSSQTPTKAFVFRVLLDSEHRGPMKSFVQQMTQLMTYYHFAFEDYTARLISDLHPEGKQWIQALTSTSSPPSSLELMNPKDRVIRMSLEAVAEASKTGKFSLAFFPSPQVPFLELDAVKYMNAEWWEQVLKKGQSTSQEKQEFFNLVERLYQKMGIQMREQVLSEWKQKNN